MNQSNNAKMSDLMAKLQKTEQEYSDLSAQIIANRIAREEATAREAAQQAIYRAKATAYFQTMDETVTPAKTKDAFIAKAMNKRTKQFIAAGASILATVAVVALHTFKK
jgi:hypothetical protein